MIGRKSGNMGESKKKMGETEEKFYKLKVNKREFERKDTILREKVRENGRN